MGSLNDSQNLLHAICSSIYIILIVYSLNDDIPKIEKPYGICSLTFVVDEFSGLFSHPSIFSIKHPRQMVSYQIFDIDEILINISMSSERIIILRKSLFPNTFLCYSSLYFVLKE